MVSVWLVNSDCPSMGSSPGWEVRHCVEFLDKTFYSHSASLQPGAQMATGEFNAGDNPTCMID